MFPSFVVRVHCREIPKFIKVQSCGFCKFSSVVKLSSMRSLFGNSGCAFRWFSINVTTSQHITNQSLISVLGSQKVAFVSEMSCGCVDFRKEYEVVAGGCFCEQKGHGYQGCGQTSASSEIMKMWPPIYLNVNILIYSGRTALGKKSV